MSGLIMNRRLKLSRNKAVLRTPRYEAKTLALKTQELARGRHAARRALGRPHRSPSTERMVRRAGTSYSALARKPATRRKATTALNGSKALMMRRTSRLIAANLRLQRGVVQHKTTEEALTKSRRRYANLLKASHQEQEKLRHVTRRLLSNQEAERCKMSHDLRDEIAQTLLGINVRLLTLKKVARGNTTILRKEIASTQRVVKRSVESIHRLAREMNVPRSA